MNLTPPIGFPGSTRGAPRLNLTPELAGWTLPNDTTLRSPDGSIEIGDAAQTSFYPQFKVKEHNNSVNFSLRLALADYTADNLSVVQNEVVYGKGNLQCRFRYETGLPQTVNIGGMNYIYPATDRFGFKLVLNAAPAINYFDFTVNGLNIALHHQPPLTAQEITDGMVREDHVVNSIAIKNTVGLLDSRKSTKIGHLFRATVVDAVGNRTWADWSIQVAPNVRLTIPQAFLNTATYPVTVE